MSTNRRSVDTGFEGEHGVLPATLSEEQEDIVQLQKIRRMTVEPGYMRLPVSQVTTAKNSDNWAIDVDHPVEGDLRFFVSKPVNGWSRDYKIVRLFEQYGITNENPHELQTRHIYVKKNEEESDQAHGWVLAEPPGYSPPKPPLRERLSEKMRQVNSMLSYSREGRGWEAIWSSITVSAIIANLITFPVIEQLLGVVGTALVTLVFVAVGTISGMVIAEVLE